MPCFNNRSIQKEQSEGDGHLSLQPQNTKRHSISYSENCKKNKLHHLMPALLLHARAMK
jgi:hypothetical protein